MSPRSKPMIFLSMVLCLALGSVACVSSRNAAPPRNPRPRPPEIEKATEIPRHADPPPHRAGARDRPCWPSVDWRSFPDVSRCIDAGADVNARIRRDDAPPLHPPVQHPPAGWRAARAPTGETTPLHLVAQYADTPEAVEVLLDGGADIDAQDAWGRTPLEVALRHNRDALSVVEVLRRAGGSLAGPADDSNARGAVGPAASARTPDGPTTTAPESSLPVRMQAPSAYRLTATVHRVAGCGDAGSTGEHYVRIERADAELHGRIGAAERERNELRRLAPTGSASPADPRRSNRLRGLEAELRALRRRISMVAGYPGRTVDYLRGPLPTYPDDELRISVHEADALSDDHCFSSTVLLERADLERGMLEVPHRGRIALTLRFSRSARSLPTGAQPLAGAPTYPTTGEADRFVALDRAATGPPPTAPRSWPPVPARARPAYRLTATVHGADGCGDAGSAGEHYARIERVDPEIQGRIDAAEQERRELRVLASTESPSFIHSRRLHRLRALEVELQALRRRISLVAGYPGRTVDYLRGSLQVHPRDELHIGVHEADTFSDDHCFSTTVVIDQPDLDKGFMELPHRGRVALRLDFSPSQD